MPYRIGVDWGSAQCQVVTVALGDTTGMYGTAQLARNAERKFQ
ncbi:hypothetical protein [Schleiferilactobacillus perolens]|nr:hypothetical protein [Schleiferilactobacillus perolens]